jgi:hypothetical protein
MEKSCKNLFVSEKAKFTRNWIVSLKYKGLDYVIISKLVFHHKGTFFFSHSLCEIQFFSIASCFNFWEQYGLVFLIFWNFWINVEWKFIIIFFCIQLFFIAYFLEKCLIIYIYFCKIKTNNFCNERFWESLWNKMSKQICFCLRFKSHNFFKYCYCL